MKIKQFLSFFLILAIVFGLWACDDTVSSKTTDQDDLYIIAGFNPRKYSTIAETTISSSSVVVSSSSVQKNEESSSSVEVDDGGNTESSSSKEESSDLDNSGDSEESSSSETELSSSSEMPSSSSVEESSSSEEESSSSQSFEQTYAFGYAMGNIPTPSKGCGKDNTLKDNFTFTSDNIEHEIYLSLPENYDKNKPYRLVFGMHYMGGSAEAVAKREAYYGLRNQSGAKENTIFVAPHGYTTETSKSGRETQNPWRCGDDKDHIFFDEFLTYLNENLCIDTSRVFAVGFSFGAMFANSLAQDFQHRLRGVVVFATMDEVIYLPKNKGLPIAWMGTVGMSDELCTPKFGRSSRDRILKNNGKPDADGNFTDARGETADEYTGSGKHVCYDYKTVDPRFPVKWCTFNGKHEYNASDEGKVWTTPTAWEFITQF